KSKKQEQIEKKHPPRRSFRPVHQENRQCPYNARCQHRFEYDQQLIYSDVSPETTIDASKQEAAYVDDDHYWKRLHKDRELLICPPAIPAQQVRAVIG